MRQRNLTLIVLGMVFLILIAGCEGGDKTPAGAPKTPFIGGIKGMEIKFLEGYPPAEVTDGKTFPFQAIVNLKNEGEFQGIDGEAKVSLIGFLPSDFRENSGDFADSDLINKRPEAYPTARSRDSEGKITEPVDMSVIFPKDDKSFNFNGQIPGNVGNVFVFRANVCYKYQTKAVAEICALKNLIDVAKDSICNPSGDKPIFVSGSPVQITSFRQSVAGNNQIRFSFDIEHVGPGTVFERKGSGDVQCPKDPSERRGKENKVEVKVDTGLNGLNCVGAGTGKFVPLVDGKRTITCTQDLDPNRNDFKKIVNIVVEFDYLDHADKEILVQHLIS